MDYEKYYLNQAENFPTFKGVRYQRGSGIGGVLKRLLTWIYTIIKEPLKDIGKTVVSGASNFANDAIEGKDLKESFQNRKNETFDLIKKKVGFKGKGIINRKTKKKLIKTIKHQHSKRKFDLFDKNELLP